MIPALGLVLAGGRGQRVGGADKGLLPWQGRPLAAWVLDALRPQVTAVAISANRHLDAYAALGAPVFRDADPEAFEGPMAGLRTALTAAESAALDWAWIVPCDAPLLPGDLGAALWAARGDAAAVMARTPDGRLQPTHALVQRRLLPALTQTLSAPGERRLGAWLTAQGAALVDWPTPLSNFNTAQALADAAR